MLPPPASQPPRVITLTWSNLPVSSPAACRSIVYRSTDLVHWSEIARLPYASSCTWSVTNSLPSEFFSVRNALLIDGYAPIFAP